MTHFFTWEEQPTRDPDTGYLTKTGYIPVIQTEIKYIVSYLFLFHIVYSAVRMAFHYEILLTSWFLLDVPDIPTNVLAYTIQVEYTLQIHKLKHHGILKKYMPKKI